MDRRPKLSKDTRPEDFQDFYWYRQELVDFCGREGLDKHGAKMELATRIETYLRTGNRENHQQKVSKILSKFDWHTEELSLDTIITDSYKNSQNVRRFFQDHVDVNFKFNVEFMGWMKNAQGKTLGDAIARWKEIAERKRNDTSHKNIAPQFEYNTYIRDFMKDNPSHMREEAIACWKVKKSLRGDNKYISTDLAFITEPGRDI